MKVAVMMAALVACCMGDAPVEVKGALSCPHYFHYRISLWASLEEDTDMKIDPHDMVYRGTVLASNGTATPYLALGVADDGEPVLTIEHNCNSLYKCLCKKWLDIHDRFEAVVNVDLAKPQGLEDNCNLCETARTTKQKK